jgi:hypothetical protein
MLPRSSTRIVALIGFTLVSILLCGLSHSEEKFVGPNALSATGTGGGGVIFDLKLATAASGRFVILDFPLNRALRSWNLASPQKELIFSWDGTDESGKSVIPGGYFIIGLLDSGQNQDCVMKRFSYHGQRASVKVAHDRSHENIIKLMSSSDQSVESGGTFTVTYVLSSPAQIRSFIADAAGLSIKELQVESNSSALSSGNGQLLVECNGTRGEPLPIGRYSLLLTAFTPNQMETRHLEFDVISSHHEIAGSTSNGLSGGAAGSGVSSGGSAGNGTSAGGPSSGTEGSGTDGSTGGKSNNGVRDHGIGQGRDGAGQGKGNGSSHGNK